MLPAGSSDQISGEKEFSKKFGIKSLRTETTASSSGIPDSDLTILSSDDSISPIICKVEKELKKLKYSVASIAPAGRTILENIASRVKHSKLVIIVVTKNFAKKSKAFLNQITYFNDKTRHTLILYEEDQKFLSNHNFPKLILPKNFKKNWKVVVKYIDGFIRAIEVSNGYFKHNPDDTKAFRKCYSDLLLHSVINPLKSTMALPMPMSELEKRFEEKYGAFKNLLVGDMKEHLLDNAGFSCSNEIIKQTDDGAMSAHYWCTFEGDSNQDSNSSNYCIDTSLSPPKVERGAIDEIALSRPNALSCSNASNRVEDWVYDQVSPQAKEAIKLRQKEYEPLDKLQHEFDSRYNFFLISGKSTPADKFQGVAKIPWIKVFDFDTNSRRTGLLSSVEGIWKKKRLFSISTSASQMKNFSYDSTDWFFPLGFSDQSESLFDGSALSWFKNIKRKLEEMFSDIENFCALQTMPVFLILWYDCEKSNSDYLGFLLSLLLSAFVTDDDKPLKVIMCIDEESSKTNCIEDVISRYELNCRTVSTSPDIVFQWLADKPYVQKQLTETLRLPTDLSKRDSEIVEVGDNRVQLWISEFLEILSLKSQDQILERKSDDFGQVFVKGGVISWDELASNDVAVQRCGKSNLQKCIEEDVILRQKSVVFKIRHAPGGGGTTLARQILWDLHTKVPCGVVKPSLSLSVVQISERVRYIHDLTHLPVVLLIDGRSEYEINQLYENCKYAIVILNVQRCSQNMPDNTFQASSRTFRLPGRVKKEEASQLTKLFSSFSSTHQSTEALETLTEEVHRGQSKYVFEYGLAAFDHEFKGVQKYVQGYMNLREQESGVENLKSWQKVIAYLSLVLYYGQSGLHRQTFHGLLKKYIGDKFVSLDDLEYSGKQFIIETKKEWKINYHVVAKEILEQILSGKANESIDAELSQGARKNLHLLVIEFIVMIKKASKGRMPEGILHLLSNMLIRRDYSEVDKSDGFRRKYVLSKLLEDIPVKDHRVLILKELTKAFPKKAEFHAHLGRLLNIMEKYSDAEISLKKALKLRSEECSRLNVDSDDMLSRIHHMFGIGYTFSAKNELKRAKKAKKMHCYNYNKMLKKIIKAVEHFVEARRYATHDLSYGYIGEVRVRLLAAEFVHEAFSGRCRAAFENHLGTDHLMLSEFVCESHSVCDRLLAECSHYTSKQELERVNDYIQCIEKFTYYYRNISNQLPLWDEVNPSIPMRRSHIASLKMQHRNGNIRSSIANISRSADLDLVIKLHERIFREIFEENMSNVSMTIDALEWLEAIRHDLAKPNYSLVKVLEVVEQWEKRNESNYSTFYLYVINFALALFSPGQELNIEYYNKSKALKEKLQIHRQKFDIKVWRLEWIACYEDNTNVKMLIHQDRLGAWDKDKRFWKEDQYIQKLKVFTGTVISSSHPLKGSISLDIVQSNYKRRIEIYFVPKLYDLNKSVYADEKLRVEFCIGFSFQHGAEAFCIQKLEKKYCQECAIESEHITINAKNGKCLNCQV